MKRDEFYPGRAPLDVTDVGDKRSATQATDCALVVTPHPMTVQGQIALNAHDAGLVPGETLAEFLQRHGVVSGKQWVVSLGGIEVPEASWQRVHPKAGHLIEARRVPQQDALRLAAVIAVMYYAPYLASMIGVTSKIGIALVQLAGTLVVNKLLAPKLPDAAGSQARGGAASSPTYSISGGRNKARQFEPMPLMLGQPYCVPDLAAQPYTYFANGEQHLWQLFHAGLNCAAVDTIRIGQTPVGNYLGVSLSYAGFASGNTGLPLLSNVDSVAGALLDAPSGSGPLVTRTSSVNATQLAVDIEGNLYSVNSTNGAYENLSCDITLEYRLVGSGTWLPFVGSVATITLNSASTKPLRLTYTRQVAAGQYEVQARKVTANVTASNQQNSIQWSTLKTYQVDNGSYKGESRFGIQVQASGQLNGSLDEVNCMGTAKPMPYWNGSAWVTATTRANGLSNPGAQILLLARGIRDEDGRLLAGLGFPDSQIDIESLKLFMVHCAAKGFTFDYFLQETMSIGDLLDAIAVVGMGSISFHSGKLGVIWFSDDQPVESVLNMGTIKAKSFGVDYDTQATADELEFQYFDRDRNNTWKSIRVLAPGVTMPVATARHPLTGVTTEAHAAVLARFHMAQNVYQRKTVNCEVDLEHLTFRRGTVIALSHDLTQWGYGGRVKAAVNSGGTVTLTLDDVVPAVGPGGASSRYMGLRIPGESQYRVFPVQAFSGSSRTLTLASAWPSGVPVPGDSADNPALDTVWIYDFKSTPGQKLRVTQIIPNGNMGGAKVALVPESAEFWNYVWTGAYTPPPNNSLLQGTPVVTGVTVTEQLARQGNTFYTELTATIDVTGSYDRSDLFGAIGSGTKQLLASTRGTRLSWRGGLDETWSLEVRPYSSLQAGTPYPLNYVVRGLADVPPDVTEFKIDGDRLSWKTVNAVDLAGYKIRFNYGVNTWWATAAAVHDGLVTDSPYTMNTRPSGIVTLLIKAVDTSGNESANAATIVLNLGDVLTSNVLLEWAEAPAFMGAITGGAVSAGVLQANATDLFYGPDEEPFYGADTDPFFPNSTYAELVYEWEVTVRDKGLLKLQHNVVASTYVIEYQRDNQSAFYGADNDLFYGADEEPFYGPEGDWATWPGSIEITSPEKIRARIKIAAGSTRGEISLLTFLLDVPDVTETINDLVIAPGGTRLPLTKAYRAIKGLQLTVQADGNGGLSARIKDKNPILGPLVAVVNSAEVEVAGLLDADIQGH